MCLINSTVNLMLDAAAFLLFLWEAGVWVPRWWHRRWHLYESLSFAIISNGSSNGSCWITWVDGLRNTLFRTINKSRMQAVFYNDHRFVTKKKTDLFFYWKTHKSVGLLKKKPNILKVYTTALFCGKIWSCWYWIHMMNISADISTDCDSNHRHSLMGF